MKIKAYLTVLFFSCLYLPLRAQQGQSEFESTRLYADLSNSYSQNLINALNKDDESTFAQLQEIFSSNELTNAAPSAELGTLKTEVSNALKVIENGGDVSVVLVYRTLTNIGSNFDIDYSSINTKIFHKTKSTGKFTNYLLATKNVYFVFVDQSDDYYSSSDVNNVDKKLFGTAIKIIYKTSHMKQSFKALVKVWGAMGGAAGPKLGITVVKIKPSRIKDPCDIILSNKSFKEDLTFSIHEANIASFQIGVSNSKLSAKNLSISNGNLVIKPNEAQSEEWKSNAYALFEIHLPRDIDNFRPLWKTFFTKRPDDEKIAVDKWLYDNTISRIGLYGGVKIDKDPLANLYAGFNYAVTKELAVNFGWVWANEVTPQVTAIGDITSVKDALKYADRKYSKGKISIGLSFTPSAFATTLGIKSKSEDAGN
jgi:hypothetical protein